MKDLWIKYIEGLEEGQEATDEGFIDYCSGLVDAFEYAFEDR